MGFSVWEIVLDCLGNNLYQGKGTTVLS